jgi:hypothetical protein
LKPGVVIVFAQRRKSVVPEPLGEKELYNVETIRLGSFGDHYLVANALDSDQSGEECVVDSAVIQHHKFRQPGASKRPNPQTPLTPPLVGGGAAHPHQPLADQRKP